MNEKKPYKMKDYLTIASSNLIRYIPIFFNNGQSHRM